MNNAGHNPKVKKPEYLTYIPTTRRYNAFHKAMDREGSWGFKHVTAGPGYWSDIHKFAIGFSIARNATDDTLKEIENEIRTLEPWISKICLFRNDPNICSGTFHLQLQLPTGQQGGTLWHLIKSYYGTETIAHVDASLFELLKHIRKKYYLIEDSND